jgi:hypothetical protein
MDEPLKLMATFPHPDDETLEMGPTLAKYSAEGVATVLICATTGQRGWTGPEDENPGLAPLGKIREGEKWNMICLKVCAERSVDHRHSMTCPRLVRFVIHPSANPGKLRPPISPSRVNL